MAQIVENWQYLQLSEQYSTVGDVAWCVVQLCAGEQSSSLAWVISRSHPCLPLIVTRVVKLQKFQKKTPQLLLTLLDFNCVENIVCIPRKKDSTAYLISNCSCRTSDFSETVTECQDVLECGTQQLRHYAVSSTMFAGEIWLRCLKKVLAHLSLDVLAVHQCPHARQIALSHMTRLDLRRRAGRTPSVCNSITRGIQRTPGFLPEHK